MPKEKKKQGRVFVETSKGVFPYDLLQKAEQSNANSSKQLEATQKWMTQNNLIPPPYDPISFLTLYESNSVFWRCVNQLASDVSGLGYRLELREDKKDSQSEFDRINAFLSKPNPEESLRSILKSLLIDWGAIGYWSLEVARNNKQDIAEIYHMPAQTVKVHKSKRKFCQIRRNKKAWFKKFGDPQNISVKTGKEIAGRTKDRANELIFYKNHYPKSDYYGAPNILSAVGDIMGLIGLRDYNLAFFENYGVPAALIVLEGDWEEGSATTVQNFLNKEIRGSENAHRTLVVEQPENAKLNYTKLGIEVKESSFKLYEKTRQEDILIAYSMPPERVGIRVVGKLGGNVAEEATQVYVSSVVEPLQLDVEEIINDMLLQSEIYEFKFNDIDTRDLDALSTRLLAEIGSAVRTPNEARNELGLKPYPEGDKFYIQSSFIEVGEAVSDMKLAREDVELEGLERES
jgi:PBSX family phage portal protein